MSAKLDKDRGCRLREVLQKISEKSDSRVPVDDMADVIGFPRSTIYEWFKGRNIDNSALARIAELGGNLEYLLLGTGTPLCQEGKSAPRPTREADEEGTASASGSAAPEVLEAIAEHQAVLNSILRVLLREPGKAHRVREVLQACEEPLSRLREIS